MATDTELERLRGDVIALRARVATLEHYVRIGNTRRSLECRHSFGPANDEGRQKCCWCGLIGGNPVWERT